MVEEFRHGKIEVLVNVDVFSEGFDCPDVEFVQLARPTLSLAKYLQQGRTRIAEIGGQGGVYADRQCGAVPHFRASYTAMELGCYVPGTDGGKGEFARTDEL